MKKFVVNDWKAADRNSFLIWVHYLLQDLINNENKKFIKNQFKQNLTSIK
jgi:hypothetical protein